MNQPEVHDSGSDTLVNIVDASKWASSYLDRPIAPSNISYLIQYGRINRYKSDGKTLICLNELKTYYDSCTNEAKWKEILGTDLNWALSFAEYKESERTKHVHRLHPYKGKFIPQLVEYFLDSHVDSFKTDVYFHSGDIILDPFCGSGTTLVQANELGMHAIGVDVSSFNSLISNVKVTKHDFAQLSSAIRELTEKLSEFQKGKRNVTFEEHLLYELSLFNSKHFPSPHYRKMVRTGTIDEKKYATEKEKKFLETYYDLVEKYRIKIRQDRKETFLDKWFLAPVRNEIDFMFEELKKIENISIKNVIAIILSRTIRSCRATTHADLATLKEPVTTTYYCKKHGKICKPIFSIGNWWKRYSKDTLKRLSEFSKLRTDTYQICLTADSRTVDIFKEVDRKNPEFARILRQKRIRGIFSSPPYVGLINYHEQHAYAYELFGYERRDELEIGPLFRGTGKEARDSYVEGISAVLNNCKTFLQEDYDIFLVANDKHNLYPLIAEQSGMKIVNRFKRPVLNRVEKDRSAYAEIIFHLKEK